MITLAAPDKLTTERYVSLTRKFMDTFGDNEVKGILLPLPPAEAKQVVYMPDCFESKNFDEKNSIDHHGHSIKVLGVKPTDFGPAFLFKLKLRDILRINEYSDRIGDVEAKIDAACASVSFHEFMRDDEGLIYADRCVINSLSWGGSCNGGSHVVFPLAPHLTSITQRQKDYGKMDLFEQQLIFADPFESEDFFPEETFGSNKWVDDKVGLLYVTKDLGKNLNKLGQWALSYLAKMDNNIFNLEVLANEVDG